MPPSRSRRAGSAVAACLLASVCLSFPGQASASRTQPTIFDATQALLSAPTAKKRDAILNQLDNLGVDTLRLVLPWRFLVPAAGKHEPPAGFNPANPHDYPQFRWSAVDAAVLGAERRGIGVLLTPSSPFPNWATRSGSSRLRDPKPASFRDFLTALGRRYGGDFRVDPGRQCDPLDLTCQPQDPSPLLPRVTHWSLMNEPNQDLFLRPQRRNGRPYSPILYRRLFLAGQAGLAAGGHERDSLLIGETAPSGGRRSVDPLDFMRGVLCLDSSYHRRRGCAPISATGWAHHPYSPGVAPFRRSDNPALINFENIGELVRGLRRAAAAGATTKRLRVYVTEFGVQSRPDRAVGVSLKRQVAYLAIAEFMAWTDGSIRSYAQYLLRDDAPGQDFSFTTGLEFHNGRHKPSMRSFPITMLPKRIGSSSRVLLWGHVRPVSAPQRVEVRYRNATGPPHLLRTVRTNGRGYFSFKAPYRAGRKWAASATLPGGRRLAGPFLHAFSF